MKDINYTLFQEIRQAVKRGEVRMWVNSYGYIIMQDTETNERLAVAHVGDKWDKWNTQKGSK